MHRFLRNLELNLEKQLPYELHYNPREKYQQK